MKRTNISLCVAVTMAAFLSGSLSAQTSNRPQILQAYGSFGINVGDGGMIPSTEPGLEEVFLTGSQPFSSSDNHFWQALRYDPTTETFVQTFRSPSFATEVVYMSTADVHPDPGDEIVIVRLTGEIHVFDQVTKVEKSVLDTGISPVNDFKHIDLDGDGYEDYLLLSNSGTHLMDATGFQFMNPTNMTGNSLVVGQLDADPALEVATTQGWVLDLGTRQFQCNFPSGFGAHLNLSDVDGDGMQELVYIKNDLVWAFDVDLCDNKWWFSVQRTNHVVVADTNGDGTDEIIVAAQSGGDFHAYDLTTQAFVWTIHNPEFDVGSLALADLDHDGRDELAWGAGSSGNNRLFIANLRTGAMEWSSDAVQGPFHGPILADVDGDGEDEVVTASTSSGYIDGGRIAVLGQVRFAPKLSGEVVGGRDVRALTVYDLDGDGDLEILVGGGTRVEAYDYAPDGTFTLLQTLLETNDDDVHSVDVGDFDGDGAVEILMGLGGGNNQVVRYDYLTGVEEWRSLHMGGQYGYAVDGLLHGDFDGDGQDEIAAMLSGDSCYVYSTSGILEAAFFADLNFMQSGTAAPGSPIPLRFGDDTGDVSEYLWNGSSYQINGSLSLLATPLDGFSTWTRGRIWLGSEGMLHLLEAATGIPLWTSELYEPGLGINTIELDSGSILTSGEDGIFVFGIR